MARAADPELARATVLIVEDEQATANLIATTLETHGYATRVAASAEEAIALVFPVPPGAIVVDLVQPQMSGLLLVAQLKTDPATRDIVIIATGPFSPQDAAHIARDAGCATYVRKPLDAASFVGLLREHLERTK